VFRSTARRFKPEPFWRDLIDRWKVSGQSIADAEMEAMAKKPEDRYQTPAEVAAVLSSVLSMGDGTAWRETESSAQSVPANMTGTDAEGETLPSAWADLGRNTPAPPPSSQAAVPRRWLLYGLAGGCIALLGIGAMVLALL
jgi:hypothetical protein